MKKKPLIKIKHKIYIHHSIKIGWFIFSLYILGSKFSLRLGIEKCWEN